MLRQTPSCQIELLEHISHGIRLVRRTYFDDKREIFHILKRVDTIYLARIDAVYFHTETIIYEDTISARLCGGMILFALFIFAGSCTAIRWRSATPAPAEKEAVVDGAVLFAGREYTPLMLLKENEKKKSLAIFEGLEKEVALETELTPEGLRMFLSASGASSDFQLSN